jgi:hypothetical protein
MNEKHPSFQTILIRKIFNNTNILQFCSDPFYLIQLFFWKSTIFLSITPYSLITFWWFGGTCCINQHDQRVSQVSIQQGALLSAFFFLITKMGAVCSRKMSVNFCHTTRYKGPEGSTLHSHGREKLKSNLVSCDSVKMFYNPSLLSHKLFKISKQLNSRQTGTL